MIDRLKKWATTTLKEAIFTNWSELLATALAFYGYHLDNENWIFGVIFWALLVYWIFWRLLGFSKGFK